ncbi:hypothetical protein LRP67_00750 [Nocardioides sp. cx-169]|uniref:hypothetical protein n=1 Tax=Nocardioides sp. cx-169 TaxID=2899080 RepID=UPI001E3CD80D|nr:hypothetical protein [Nocardioides sp. cx-169]MCD4532618.1 hypothetical protein [Nocardioides sp. cx-169]
MPPPLTRGPLPASVYWRRRLVLVGLVTVLVVSLARLLSGSSDGSSQDEGAAQQAAGAPTSSDATLSASSSPSSTATRKPRRTPTQPSTSAAPTLAEPDGPCAADDLEVTPSVVDAVVGRDVVVLLDVRTLVDEACTWQVSSSSLTLRIRSGSDKIWSSAQCPRVLPVKDLVVRRDVGTTVPVIWGDARRSDKECSRQADWAMPGFYQVAAAALGGEPTEVQFELTRPVPEVITPSAAPSSSPTGGAGGSGAGSGGGSGGGKPNQPDDDAKPSGKPSGAVEPNGSGIS